MAAWGYGVRVMSGKNWRAWVLGIVALAGVAAAFLFSPIPQDSAYHEFTDQRTFFGIPNFCNVFSNLPFVLVGAFGLRSLSRLPPSSPGCEPLQQPTEPTPLNGPSSEPNVRRSPAIVRLLRRVRRYAPKHRTEHFCPPGMFHAFFGL